MEINLEEIYQILHGAQREPMSEANYEKSQRGRASRLSRDTGATAHLGFTGANMVMWRMPRSHLVTFARNARNAECTGGTNPKR